MLITFLAIFGDFSLLNGNPGTGSISLIAQTLCNVLVLHAVGLVRLSSSSVKQKIFIFCVYYNLCMTPSFVIIFIFCRVLPASGKEK